MMLILDTKPEFANAFKSSENAAYPVDNAYNLDRRRKMWRSSGYFEIIAGENTLVFRESVGVDLSATLTVGGYSSESLFFAELKTALEAVGANTYTVTRDSTTGRIKIQSSGGFFQIMLTDPLSLDMANVIGFNTVADKTGATFYLADEIRIHTSEWLLWDFGFPYNPTALFLAGDRNEPLNISPSAIIKLQGNWTNEWTAPVFEETLEYNDFSISYFNQNGFYQSGLRYWRIEIIDRVNPDLFIELGIAWIGNNPELSRGCAVFPFSTNYIDRSDVAFSEAGQTFVSRKPKTQGFGLDWRGLDKASFEMLEKTWNYYGLHSSFIVAFDTDNALGTDTSAWCRVVKFDSPPEAELISPGNWSMTWELREEL